jgi:hypothetical protein
MHFRAKLKALGSKIYDNLANSRLLFQIQQFSSKKLSANHQNKHKMIINHKAQTQPDYRFFKKR